MVVFLFLWVSNVVMESHVVKRLCATRAWLRDMIGNSRDAVSAVVLMVDATLGT